jgi:opacity protein-like surface antigen
MKKMTAGILAVALSSSLYAGNTENYSEGRTFVGAEVGFVKLDVSANVFDTLTGLTSPTFESQSDSSTAYGFHIGAQDAEWRTTLLYSYYSNEEGIDTETIHKGGLYLDYFILQSEVESFTFMPYIGAHIGYMSYEWTEDTGFGIDQVNADDSNVYYGGQVGVAVTVAESFQFDLSYRYSLTNLKDLATDIGNGYVVNTDLDDMSEIVIGFNYFF